MRAPQHSGLPKGKGQALPHCLGLVFPDEDGLSPASISGREQTIVPGIWGSPVSAPSVCRP